MSLSNQISTYEDCFELFERAAIAKVGIRVSTASWAVARLLQMRMHQARALQRQEARRLYGRDDIRWGKSEYDSLVVRSRQDTEGVWWIYVERQNQYRVENIEELEEDAPRLDHEAPAQLTYNPSNERET